MTCFIVNEEDEFDGHAPRHAADVAGQATRDTVTVHRAQRRQAREHQLTYTTHDSGIPPPALY